MTPLNLKDVENYVEQNIGNFHKQRIDRLNNLLLLEVIKRKNPYLFKAKYLLTANDIIKSLTDAHISSNEETIFGDWLEGLAIFINEKVYGGWKSGIQGIDLEFDNSGNRYIISIKSGPNWGNKSQIDKLKTDFKKAKMTLRTSNANISVIAVNGCCYGKDRRPDKGDYYKYCGQTFWEFISGDSNLYKDIIEPIGYKAKEKNDEFMKSYSAKINLFVNQFTNLFCDANGNILWNKILEVNSGR